MNLYLITEFRVWITEKGTNSYNEKVLVSQWGKPPPPPGGGFAPCASGPAPPGLAHASKSTVRPCCIMLELTLLII